MHGPLCKKSIQKLVNMPNLRVISLNSKAWYAFKNRYNKRALYGLEGQLSLQIIQGSPI